MNSVDLIELRRENLRKWFSDKTVPVKDKSFISQIINGKVTIGERAARRLERENGMPNNFLDQSEPTTAINNLITIDALNIEMIAGNGSTGDLVKVVNQLQFEAEQFHTIYPKMNLKTVKIISVKGDSMLPTFKHSDLLFVDTAINHFDGDGVYVFCYGNTLYLKRLQKAGNEFIVISDNSAYKDLKINSFETEQFHIFGKVKLHQSQCLNVIG